MDGEMNPADVAQGVVAPVNAAGFSFIELFMQASIVVKIVMTGLGLASVWSWAIIFEKLLALRRFPRLFVKISHTWTLSAQPYPYLDSQEQVRRIYDAFGPKRLIAGTDWPLVEKFCTYGQAVDIARQRIAFLSAEDRRWICGLTALQVWPFAGLSVPSA